MKQRPLRWQLGPVAHCCIAITGPWLNCVVAASGQPVAVPVEVTAIVQRDVAPELSFVGTVMPLRSVTIGSAVDGRVVEFLVNDGDRVTAGQAIARLLTETLQIELAATQAELAFRQATLTELRNGSRPEEIIQAKSRMEAAEAARKFASSSHQRAQAASRNGISAVTRQELEETISTLVQAEQTFLDAQAGHALVVAGPRQEVILQAEAQLRVQEQRVRQIEDRLAKHTVRAPFDGFVTAEYTEKGAWLAQADPIADVIQLDPAEIEVNVPEKYIPFTSVGITAQVLCDAFPATSFAGTVSHIVPQADPRSRTFPVKVRVSNPLENGIHVLKAGMFARVSLPASARTPALLVPKDAVVLGGDQPVVMVVDQPEDGPATVRPVPVQLGEAGGDQIQVSGQLEPGELVVTKGNERLRPGQTVRIEATRLTAARNNLSVAN